MCLVPVADDSSQAWPDSSVISSSNFSEQESRPVSEFTTQSNRQLLLPHREVSHIKLIFVLYHS